MYFRLDDGKPVWALGKVTAEEQDIYLFTEDELVMYPEAVILQQPPPKILARAAQIEGRTLSRSEFERLLTEKTREELLQDQLDAQQAIIDVLLLESLGGGAGV